MSRKRTTGFQARLIVITFPAMFLAVSASAQDVVFVQGDRVGIGTSTPGARLDIQPVSGTNVELLVKNDAPGTGVFTVLQSANDNLIFRIFEAATGEGIFSVYNANGAENLRFTGQAGGRLGIGCASNISADIVLNAAGGGPCGPGTESTINAGATQFTVTSSRSIKKNIEVVEVDDILDRIQKVDVYQYDFVDGPEDNLGLMSEEFHEIFGRGSNKLLNGQEVTVALWLAVRELAARTDELARRNEELAAQNVELRREVERLQEAR